ncbi:MAG: PAS domain S-box protein, partial [Promethearchaeota archaeon]
MLEHKYTHEDGRNACDETNGNLYSEIDDIPNTHPITDNLTGDKRVEQLLKKKLVFERTISKIYSRFVKTMNVDVAINASLCEMGQLSGASRSYIILIDDENGITINTHEWCVEGVEPQIDKLKAIPLDKTPWWIENIKRGEIIHIKDVSKMPVEASLEKELLKSQDIKSILAFPLTIGDKISGFIGFDNIRRTGEWKEGDFSLLKISSEIIGNALKRQQVELKLKESKKNYKNLNKELEQKVKDRTEELKKSEEKFQNMLFYLDAGYYNVKMDGVILYHNLSFNKILGYHPSENLVGTRPFNFWQNSEKKKDYIKVLMKNGAIIDYNTHIKKKNGEEIVVQVNAHLVKDDKGIPISIEGTFYDITDKFRMSQKLKESEKKYKLLYKGISVPMYTWQKVDNDLILIDYNKASKEINDDKMRDYIGIKASELFKDQLELLEELHRCANEKVNFNREIKYRYNTTNKEKYLSVNYDFIPPDLVLIQMLDITERKRAEEKLKKRTKRQEILNQIIMEGNRAKNISQLSENILRSTLELIGFEGGGIYLLEKEKRIAKIVCYNGLPLDFIEDADLVKIDQSPYNKIFIKGQPIFTENYHLLNPIRSKKWGFLSLASVPIFNKDKII